MNRYRGAVALVVALGLAGATSSYARAAPGDASERAGALFRQAQQAFERKEYAAAASAFEQAARLAPHPAAWLDASEAWELDGNLARSAQDCDETLRLASISEQHRLAAAARLARLESRVATLDVKSSRTLVMSIDGGEAVAIPSRRRLAPGHHDLAVNDLAGTEVRTFGVDLARGETRVVDVAPAPPSSAPPAPIAPPAVEAAPPLPAAASYVPPVASIVAFGVSGVAAATAIGLGIATLSLESSFTRAPTVSRRDDFYRARTFTNVAWVVSGAALGAGVVVWLVAPRSRSAPSPILGVSASPTGLAVVHEGRF